MIEPSAPCASCGWIAPNGDFYPTRSAHHDDVAYALAENGRWDLEDNRWIRVWDSGNFTMGFKYDWEDECTLITQPQLDTLFDLAMEHTGVVRQNLLDMIELVEDTR